MLARNILRSLFPSQAGLYSSLLTRLLSSATTTTTDHVVTSPYPPISEGPYPPFYEFLTKNWKAHGGSLGDKVAIIDGTTGLQRTFDDYYQTARSLAGILRNEMGIVKDGTIAMYCPNTVDYLPVVLAGSLCGAKITTINPLYTTEELGPVLEHSHASVFVVHHSKLDMALKVKEIKSVKYIIVVTDNGEPVPEGTIDLASLRNYEGAFHETIAGEDNSHTLLLPYSSGTTGLPKGVCLTHDNVIVNLIQLGVIDDPVFPSNHKLVSPLPFFHIYGLTVSLLYCAWKGQTIITNSGRFDLAQFCELVQEHKPERAHLVPPILLGLAKHPIVDRYDLSSMRMIISAAAPLGQDTEAAVKNRLGLDIKQGWGMSELSPLGTLATDSGARSGSVGPPVPSTEIKIVDEEGNSLGPNQTGELLIKGPQVMQGYLDEPERTAECLCDSGWLRTGDVAWYDEEGHIYVTDRLKELIKVRGYQVAPAELEALIFKHDAVADVAVIQVEDEASGELPRAYIVLKKAEADTVTEQDIYKWVKGQVAAYKRLDGGVKFVSVIPKSASGKILRRILRDQLKEEMKAG
eukprot:scaffold8374_cov175-Amphora_coffeaeformis.AAC.18